MAITDEQNDRLTILLQALEPECKNMPDRPRGFVQDQVKRHDQYGDRIFMSPKQWTWLEDLYEQYAGGTKQEAGRDEQEDDEPQDTRHGDHGDIDDEIPF